MYVDIWFSKFYIKLFIYIYKCVCVTCQYEHQNPVVCNYYARTAPTPSYSAQKKKQYIHRSEIILLGFRLESAHMGLC